LLSQRSLILERLDVPLSGSQRRARRKAGIHAVKHDAVDLPS
jgi:hypothetical protein